MDEILGRISGGSKATKGGGENNIKRRISKSRASFDEQVMILADGDMGEYGRIKSGSVGDYLIKLDNYAQGIEREINKHKQQQASGRRK